MNNITTKQKLAIAKLLPERIWYETFPPVKSRDYTDYVFYWLEDDNKSKNLGYDWKILDTEWLQIVQWVEEGLTDEQHRAYRAELWIATDPHNIDGHQHCRNYQQASVEQRLAALEAAGIINTTKE